MAVFDLVLLIPLVVGAFNGYRKGIIMEVFGIAAFVIALVIGFKFLYLGADILEGLVGVEKVRGISPYLSFFVVFLPALFILRQAGLLVKKAFRITFLGVLDGLFGGILGAITVAFGLSVFIWILETVGVRLREETIASSELYPFLKGFAPHILSLISDVLPGGNWIDYLDRLINQLRTSH